ncbi:MAG: site-2 protease family protein [Patescibacteria group bacterium]
MTTTAFSTIIWFLVPIVALTVHEFAHALVSWQLGDITAKRAGRVTLNPFAHLDLLGLMFLLFTGVGWGKPVPANPANFRDPLKDSALTALAGPAANVFTAVVLAAMIKEFGGYFYLYPLLIASLRIGLFNLLPLAPLDGFHVFEGVLPFNLVPFWERTRSWGLPVLLLLLFPIGRSTLLERILSPLTQVIVGFLLG